ncbi:MarR family winged helix-turn-helix transcriptional regulator [Microvirga splendida]|uniref:MarR family transcriptional regulator n=1 Tax=Microvirga splendida TaxID=2795727 RepID=A0ABS0XZS9_9HYPH|nr:MarR family transcriptional regulator [Microvirga splendida]MBJ6125195.1 MarR family transcriptional regulator [Microvirga splendida]
MSGKRPPLGNQSTIQRLASHICFATYATAHAFNRVYKPLLDPLGLTYPQYLVLLVLWEKDNLTVKEVGQPLHLDSGTLTPLLKRLESAGIAQRTRDPQDERQVRVSLTKRGHDLRTPAMNLWNELLCATGLPAHELSALKDQLDRLRENLDAHQSTEIDG